MRYTPANLAARLSSHLPILAIAEWGKHRPRAVLTALGFPGDPHGSVGIILDAATLLQWGCIRRARAARHPPPRTHKPCR